MYLEVVSSEVGTKQDLSIFLALDHRLGYIAWVVGF
jgi:hypothetical protein